MRFVDTRGTRVITDWDHGGGGGIFSKKHHYVGLLFACSTDIACNSHTNTKFADMQEQAAHRIQTADLSLVSLLL